MNLTAISFVFLILCFALFTVLLGSRLFQPVLSRFVAFSQRNEALQTQIIPCLALIGLLAVLGKIAIF